MCLCFCFVLANKMQHYIVSHRECLNNITTFLKDSWTWDTPLDRFDKQWCDRSAWTLGEETTWTGITEKE